MTGTYFIATKFEWICYVSAFIIFVIEAILCTKEEVNRVNARRRQILQLLLDGRDNFRLKEIQPMFQVSERTLRYDMEQIRSWLKDYDILLEHVSGHGVWQLKEAPSPSKVKHVYDSLNLLSRSISVIERQLLITHELIMKEEWQPLRQLALELDVSKATILQQMSDVEKWIHGFSLQLERGKKGFRIIGSERRKRLALLSIMSELEESWYTVNPIVHLNWSHLSLKDLDSLKVLLRNDLQPEREAFIHTIFKAFALTIERHRSRHFLGKCEGVNIKMKSWFDDVTNKVSRYFSVPFSNEEKCFAYFYLQAIEKSFNNNEKNRFNDQPFLAFITEINNRLGLNIIDENHLSELYEEWCKLSFIIENDIIFSHPLKTQIQEQYPFLVYHVWQALMGHHEKSTNFNIDQVMSLIIQMAAIYETASYHNQRFQAWVVCTRGIATSRLLTVTLKKHLPQIEVVRTIAVTDLYEVEGWDEPDFIISSISLPDSPYPTVRVKPVLTKEEIRKIENYLTSFEQKSEQSPIQHLQEALHPIIPSSRIGFYEKEHVVLDEVIDMGVENLEKEGYVTSKFKLDLKKTIFEEKYVYEVVPGILFLHTDSTHVHKPGFSLIKLKHAYIRKNKLHSNAVLIMSTPDKSSHIPQLQYLHKILMNNEYVQAIKQWSFS